MMNLGRHMKRRFAFADAAIVLAPEALLADFHVNGDVEFLAGLDLVTNILARRQAVDRGAETGTQKRVVELLADDAVLRALRDVGSARA